MDDHDWLRVLEPGQQIKRHSLDARASEAVQNDEDSFSLGSGLSPTAARHALGDAVATMCEVAGGALDTVDLAARGLALVVEVAADATTGGDGASSPAWSIDGVPALGRGACSPAQGPSGSSIWARDSSAASD